MEWAALFAAPLAALGLVGWYGSERMTRPPRWPCQYHPAMLGLPCEEASFPSTDGLALHGWFIPSSSSAQGTVVVCHGYGGNKDALLDYAAFLRRAFHVLLFDFRAHGGSAGQRASLGYLERRDVGGALNYLRGRNAGPMGIMGFSMGAAAAILAAAAYPEIAAVVADNPFATVQGAVFGGLRNMGYPRPVAGFLSLLIAQATACRLGFWPRQGDPLAVVGNLAPRPLFLIHGAADTSIPPSHSERLYAAAGEPKELWLVGGAEHCQSYAVAGAAYEERVLHFFARSLAGQPAAPL